MTELDKLLRNYGELMIQFELLRNKIAEARAEIQHEMARQGKTPTTAPLPPAGNQVELLEGGAGTGMGLD